MWVKHGYYWRTGEDTKEVNKDIGDQDFDSLEDNFMFLKKAKVVCADYELLRRDFKEDLF
jgi:hypothetical protein